MSNSDSDLSELDDYAFDEDEGLDEQDTMEAEEGDGDVSMSEVESDGFEDDGGLDDGDMIQVTGKGKGKAAYQVDYTPLSPKDLEAEMKREIDHVAGTLSVNSKEAAALLRYMKWNKEKVMDRYFDNQDELRQEAGIDPIPEGSSGKSQPRIKRIRGFVCSICYEEGPGSKDTIALSCDHRFCKDCYSSYLTNKINNEGEAKSIQCMAGDCAIVVDERTVELLVTEVTMERYRELLNRSYVDDDPSLRWCPHPGCEYAVRCTGVTSKSLDTLVPTVLCACGNKFCFGCGREYDHAPCLCIVVKKWLQKCADDSETANWIQANTKECPKCQATIEKNGGCNHMTCKKCKYEFCWICMGEWSAHGTSWYNCNRYDPKNESKDPQSKSRASLERYLHYYNRYANHEQSAKLEKETYARIERRMEEIQNSSTLSWIEVQFLKKAVDVLSDCRNVLKWTYAMAFYLEKVNATHIFEDNQSDLEMATENLSGVIEEPFEAEDIPRLRAKVLDLTAYVQKRYQVMLDDTLSGYLDDRWPFTIDVAA